MFTFVQIAEIFNIFVGLMLAAAILVFLGGLGGYFAQLGTWPSFRDRSIKTMEWGVAILFVLVILLGTVQYFQQYPKITGAILALIIILVVGTALAKTIKMGSEPKKERGRE